MNETKTLEQRDPIKTRTPVLYGISFDLAVYVLLGILPQSLSLRDRLIHQDITGQVVKKVSGSGRFLSTYNLKVRYPYKEKSKGYIISLEAKEWSTHSSGSQIKFVQYGWEGLKVA